MERDFWLIMCLWGAYFIKVKFNLSFDMFLATCLVFFLLVFKK